jgi:hypothetical protein
MKVPLVRRRCILGRVLWERKPARSATTALGGHKLYFEFKTVVTLIRNERIRPDDVDATYYDEFLTRLRDGNCDEVDYNRIWTTCSKMCMGDAAWERRGFTGQSVTELYATNREVDDRNAIRLKALQKPIAKLQTNNSCPQARKLSSDRFYGIKNLLYISVGAAVVLEQNLCPEFGLADIPAMIHNSFQLLCTRKAEWRSNAVT